MTAVIYARYSSDNQREESIEGQIREKIRVSIAGFPTEELLEWMFNSRILKDGELEV